MKAGSVAVVILALALVAELVLVPVDRVLASPPNIPTCLPPKLKTTLPQCSSTAGYYAGGASLTYCFLGEGALYLKGVYYPLTQPGASPARQVANSFCPGMQR